jgi:hypothetical protein
MASYPRWCLNMREVNPLMPLNDAHLSQSTDGTVGGLISDKSFLSFKIKTFPVIDGGLRIAISLLYSGNTV